MGKERRKLAAMSGVWSSLQSADLDGGAEVEEAPGDDDVVVAAHQPRHHRAAVAHTLQARVDLAQQTCSVYFQQMQTVSRHIVTQF